MKKNGFTLIELLAVIVILAIIAIIAVPIILNIVNDSKEEATLRSAENYLGAVKLSIAQAQLEDKNKNFDGTYKISEDGKVITRDEETILNVAFDGEGLYQGTLIIENGKVTKISNGKIDKWFAKIVLNRVVLLDELPSNTLVTGQKFNAAIKTLAKGSTVKYNTSDSIITSIEFLTDGILPEGYTKEELNELKSVDVSEKQNGTILAFYDGNGSIYVYSEDGILGNINCDYMFNSFLNLTILDISSLRTTGVINMNHMFSACSSLITLDVSNLATSSVTDMSFMFSGCSALTTLDVSKWDTSSVVKMNQMFYNCKKLTELNVSDWVTSNVTNMHQMFFFCEKLLILDVSKWNTSSVTDMGGMFCNCYSLTMLDVSNFDTQYVEDMSYMFASNYTNSTMDIAKIVGIEKMNTSKVQTMQGMFMGCSNLTELDVSNFITSNVINMSNMFRNCKKLTELNVSDWVTSNVTNMNYMFYGCSNLICIQVGDGWAMENATVTKMFTAAGTSSVTTESCPVTSS